MRARGFKEIYNPELPLESLWDLIDRARFSTHIKDIQFKSDGERQEAMRPIWNSSSGEGEINLDVCYRETQRGVKEAQRHRGVGGTGLKGENSSELTATGTRKRAYFEI